MTHLLLSKVGGKDIKEGLPVQRTVDHREMAFILDKSIQAIEQGIIQVLEVCPPELASDIYQNGIHLTGGGALLRGLANRLQKNIQLPIHLDREPLLSVSKGISQALRDTKKYHSVLV